ncbi:MAG TPA: nitroreductase family protein [Dehalococcoidia bacterium]|nr:nitroreductase family protein [Dehalococcoidia bacterium]
MTTRDDADFYSLIAQRRSIRSYVSQPLPRDLIERLLEAAIWAPSAHNRQPWRFAAVTQPEAKQRLASEMGQRLRADRTRDGDAEDAIEADARRSYQRITGAPCVIVVCLTMEDMDTYPDERRSQAEYLMAVQGAALATENLLLAAELEGLGACWMCAPLFCQETVAGALELPEHWLPQGLITLGYASGHGKPPIRRPLDDMVLWR